MSREPVTESSSSTVIYASTSDIVAVRGSQYRRSKSRPAIDPGLILSLLSLIGACGILGLYMLGKKWPAFRSGCIVTAGVSALILLSHVDGILLQAARIRL